MNNQAKWAYFLRSDTSAKAKVIYLLLCEYMAKYGRCYIRQNTMAKQLKWSRRTVIRCLDELEQLQWIRRKRLKSSCEYTVHFKLLNDVSGMAYISKLNNTKDTTKEYSTKNTRDMPDMAYLGKRLSRGYRMKVNEPNTPAKTTKAQHDKKMKFLESMDKYDREEFWKLYMAGKVKLPWDIKL